MSGNPNPKNQFVKGSQKAIEAGRKSVPSMSMKKIINQLIEHDSPKKWVEEAGKMGQLLPKGAEKIADLLHGRLLTEAIFGLPNNALKAQEMIYKMRGDFPKEGRAESGDEAVKRSFLFKVVDRNDQEKEVHAELITDD